jgi:hypothetical protein
MIVNWIVLFDTNITIFTLEEYGSKFKQHRNSLWDAGNSPNNSQIYTFQEFDFVTFWRRLYTLQDILVSCSITSGGLKSTREVVSEHMWAHHYVLCLSGSICKHLQVSVQLFRVAELLSYYFKTIFHFADVQDSKLRLIDNWSTWYFLICYS